MSNTSRCCAAGSSHSLSLVDFLHGVAGRCDAGPVSEGISSAPANDFDVYEENDGQYGPSACVKCKGSII